MGHVASFFLFLLEIASISFCVFFFAPIFLNPLSTALLGKKGPSLGTCQRPHLRVWFASLYSFSRANDFLLLTKCPKIGRDFLPEDTCSFSAKRPTLCLMFFSRNRASLFALLLARRLNRSYGAKTAKTLKHGKSDNAFKRQMSDIFSVSFGFSLLFEFL